MEVLFLQAWGGGFFLLNKIFLWKSERIRRRVTEFLLRQSCTDKTAEREAHKASRGWRIASWAIYLLGLTPWLKIFYDERDWIAMYLEASGAPAMLLGLILAIVGLGKPRKGRLGRLTNGLDHLTLLIIPIGLGVSIWYTGLPQHLSQWLEIAFVTGYLIGTRELGLERARGYLWFLLMHVSCVWLMLRQSLVWLMWLQIISFIFIADAYRVWLDGRKRETPRPF